MRLERFLRPVKSLLWTSESSRFLNSIILGLGKKNEDFVKFKVDSLEKNIRILNRQLSRFQDGNKFLLLEQDKQKIKDINNQEEVRKRNIPEERFL